MILPFYGIGDMVRRAHGHTRAPAVSLPAGAGDPTSSKAEFSNITTPLFLTTGFFFLQGPWLQAHDRLLSFLPPTHAQPPLQGRERPTPLRLHGCRRLHILLMPILVHSGAYFAQRAIVLSRMGRLRALAARAIREGSRPGWSSYFGQPPVPATACLLSVPWLVYYLDNQTGANSHQRQGNFHNAARMASQYQVTHDLLRSIRMLTGDSTFHPFPPVVFEKRLSVVVSSDGFGRALCGTSYYHPLDLHLPWRRKLGLHLLPTSLYRKPIEAALLLFRII